MISDHFISLKCLLNFQDKHQESLSLGGWFDKRMNSINMLRWDFGLTGTSPCKQINVISLLCASTV